MQQPYPDPACVQRMAARHHLAAARDEVYGLLDGLPMHKRAAAADLYSQLCGIHNRLEELLADTSTPTVIYLQPSDTEKGASHAR